ncbi:MAG: hypothetical protein JNM09_09710 [Blastocatellia bacterium]|nr:hypothetical protein [Blastocatellia bacterium]
MQRRRLSKCFSTGATMIGVMFLSLLMTACNHSNATPNVEKAQTSHSSHASEAPSTEVAQKIPHYFENPDDAKPFPKTLDPATMKTTATKQAYATARRIPEVLAQQPCYCFCDKGFGHGSLLDCHIDNHSAD